jgi:hypothetical protein
MERFKRLKSPFEGYSISELGRVFSHKRNIYLKQNENLDGYLVVRLSGGSRRAKKTFTVHKLVLTYFKPTKVKNLTVNHINTNRKDNRLENLEWLTHAENVKHSRELGRYSTCGFKNSRSKLNEKQVVDIRSRYEDGEIIYRIWKEHYNFLTYRTVSLCAKGVTYAT